MVPKMLLLSSLLASSKKKRILHERMTLHSSARKTEWEAEGSFSKIRLERRQKCDIVNFAWLSNNMKWQCLSGFYLPKFEIELSSECYLWMKPSVLVLGLEQLQDPSQGSSTAFWNEKRKKINQESFFSSNQEVSWIRCVLWLPVSRDGLKCHPKKSNKSSFKIWGFREFCFISFAKEKVIVSVREEENTEFCKFSPSFLGSSAMFITDLVRTKEVVLEIPADFSLTAAPSWLCCLRTTLSGL